MATQKSIFSGDWPLLVPADVPARELAIPSHSFLGVSGCDNAVASHSASFFT